jgi:hypothetical protein
MGRRKSSPLSIRFDEADFAKLRARADGLGVSVGAMVRSLVSYALNSEVETQLEGVREEIGHLHTQVRLLHADVDQLNDNLREGLRAILLAETGDEDQAREMAEEVVKSLRGEE